MFGKKFSGGNPFLTRLNNAFPSSMNDQVKQFFNQSDSEDTSRVAGLLIDRLSDYSSKGRLTKVEVINFIINRVPDNYRGSSILNSLIRVCPNLSENQSVQLSYKIDQINCYFHQQAFSSLDVLSASENRTFILDAIAQGIDFHSSSSSNPLAAAESQSSASSALPSFDDFQIKLIEKLDESLDRGSVKIFIQQLKKNKDVYQSGSRESIKWKETLDKLDLMANVPESPTTLGNQGQYRKYFETLRQRYTDCKTAKLTSELHRVFLDYFSKLQSRFPDPESNEGHRRFIKSELNNLNSHVELLSNEKTELEFNLKYFDCLDALSVTLADTDKAVTDFLKPFNFLFDFEPGSVGPKEKELKSLILAKLFAKLSANNDGQSEKILEKLNIGIFENFSKDKQIELVTQFPKILLLDSFPEDVANRLDPEGSIRQTELLKQFNALQDQLIDAPAALHGYIITSSLGLVDKSKTIMGSKLELSEQIEEQYREIEKNVPAEETLRREFEELVGNPKDLAASFLNPGVGADDYSGEGLAFAKQLKGFCENFLNSEVSDEYLIKNTILIFDQNPSEGFKKEMFKSLLLGLKQETKGVLAALVSQRESFFMQFEFGDLAYNFTPEDFAGAASPSDQSGYTTQESRSASPLSGSMDLPQDTDFIAALMESPLYKYISKCNFTSNSGAERYKFVHIKADGNCGVYALSNLSEESGSGVIDRDAILTQIDKMKDNKSIAKLLKNALVAFNYEREQHLGLNLENISAKDFGNLLNDWREQRIKPEGSELSIQDMLVVAKIFDLNIRILDGNNLESGNLSEEVSLDGLSKYESGSVSNKKTILLHKLTDGGDANHYSVLKRLPRSTVL